DCFIKMKYFAKSSEIRKNINIKDPVPFVSDNYRVSVILNNLISNAIKYNDPNKSEKWIDVAVVIDPQKAVITVEDNGIGIEDDLKPKIFQMFYRATEKSDGSGMGLYIVKENVHKIHGEIEVRSKLKKGTFFITTLPNQLARVNQV